MTSAEQARAITRDVAATQRVELVDGPAGDWRLRDGALVNLRSDFFRVIGAQVAGREELLIRQQETALVGLLVAQHPEGRRLLLSARAEPGLHGGCQLSATIQSTPSNYERRHGGAPTPRLDDVLRPARGSRVLHDSIQYDWGQYYDDKTKRFRIVETDAVEPVPPAMLWVPESTVRALAADDFSLTCDLRAALALLPDDTAPSAADAASASALPAPPDVEGMLAGPQHLRDLPLESLSDWTIGRGGIVTERRDRDILWARTRSATREVVEWVQPLMRVHAPLQVELAYQVRDDGGWEVAVREETRVGLRGHPLWFPAPSAEAGEVTSEVRASAEGGRFWRHEVDIRLVRSPHAAPGACWMPHEEARAMCRADRRSSVELRIALQLLRDTNPLEVRR